MELICLFSEFTCFMKLLLSYKYYCSKKAYKLVVVKAYKFLFHF